LACQYFGGLAFMAGGHLTVSVYRDGLIARIGAQDMDAVTAQPGVRPFDMTGRPMRGIVVIDSAMLDDEALDCWIGQAQRVAQQPHPREVFGASHGLPCRSIGSSTYWALCAGPRCPAWLARRSRPSGWRQ
jgi:TfoX N-terminal domain